MKYIIYILSCVVLISCTGDHATDTIVQVIGTRNGVEVVRGMGVCIDNSRILTSAHVVRDDTITYQVGGISHEIVERDFATDKAYLIYSDDEGRANNICKTHKYYIGKNDTVSGQRVSIPVFRSGSLIELTGSINSITGSMIAYDTLGRTQILSGIIMTDIVLMPGDSGAPILDEEGRVVDVVHVR